MKSLLKAISTRAPKNLAKEKIKAKTIVYRAKIAEFQKVFYAEQKYSLLIILQGIDASGKDGLVANVFSGLNPFGCNVAAFKSPTPEEAAHDFLWRIHNKTPGNGMIHIFNRSHYEDLLVPVVNKLMNKDQIDRRIHNINNFERLLEDNGTIILKFYLHISRAEQEQRLLERQTNPKKFWKHDDHDWSTREKWDAYMNAYETIFHNCNKPEWEIVPADQNWYKEYLVSKKVCETLEKLKLEYPKVEKTK
ncbi:MAG: polyphosphate kinase [Bacteroidetes bacterium]|jgi:PPK2 family polyphosphate:nucleotide phosphotransferase|nr:polyphosphate kinase [Bacteroidota bacterium]